MKNEKIILIQFEQKQLTTSLYSTSGEKLTQCSKLLTFKNHPNYGWVSDPHEIIYLIRSSINDLILSYKKKLTIAKIAIDGQMESILFCDQKHGTALTPAFHIKDKRATKIINRIQKTQLAKDYLSISKQHMSPYCIYAHIKWFIEEGIIQYPINLENSYCLTLESFLLLNLTSLNGVKWDTISASSSGLFDIETQKLSPIILSDLNLTKKNFPQIVHPTQINLKTKGFVPLKDDIPIVCLLNESKLHWFVQTELRFGLNHIHWTKQQAIIQKNIGNELQAINGFNNSLIYNTNQMYNCIEKELSIPTLPSTFFSSSFDNLMKNKDTNKHHKNWLILHSDLTFGDLQFALINRDTQIEIEDFNDIFLIGLFNIIKMKLLTIEKYCNTFSNQILCTTTFEVNESRWTQLANILQHSLTIIDNNSILGAFILIIAHDHDNQKKFMLSTKTILPEQDPISSYANFQEWQNYYSKIFKN